MKLDVREVDWDHPDSTNLRDAQQAELAVRYGRLDSEPGEIKRMYVVPERRGSGVARVLLHRLEGEARSRSWSRLVLETGDEQPDAMRFYSREGYTPIPNFGFYVGSGLSRCFEKRIAPARE